MGLYAKELIKEGFAKTRVEDIERGITFLHNAICLLDSENNILFWGKTVEKRLKEYAEVEELNKECLKGIFTVPLR